MGRGEVYICSYIFLACARYFLSRDKIWGGTFWCHSPHRWTTAHSTPHRCLEEPLQSLPLSVLASTADIVEFCVQYTVSKYRLLFRLYSVWCVFAPGCAPFPYYIAPLVTRQWWENISVECPNETSQRRAIAVVSGESLPSWTKRFEREGTIPSSSHTIDGERELH